MNIYIIENAKITSSLIKEIKNKTDNIVIPLNYKLIDFLEKNDIEIIKENEILNHSDYALIDEITFKLSRSWYDDSYEKISYHDVNINNLLDSELYKIFLRMIHRIILLQKLIKKIEPEIIKLTNLDMILYEISVEIFKFMNIKIETINEKTENVEIKNKYDKINFSVKIFGKNREFYVSKKMFSIIKYFYEKYWDVSYFFRNKSNKK